MHTTPPCAASTIVASDYFLKREAVEMGEGTEEAGAVADPIEEEGESPFR